MLQEFYLTKSTLRQDLLAEDIGDLFDSNAFIGLDIRGSAVTKTASVVWILGTLGNKDTILGLGFFRHIPNNAVSTLTQLLGNIILLFDNKLLVEDLECFATRHVCHG